MDRSDEMWIRAMMEILEAKIRLCDGASAALKDQIVDLEKRADDRERRIRDLEKFTWKAIGISAAVSAIATGGAITLL